MKSTGVYALIPAAGRGVRFGAPENKVFAPLLGRPLLGWTLQAFAECDLVKGIVLVGNEDDLPRLREIGEQYGGRKLKEVVLGGPDRQASVRNGLLACEKAKYVVVHDAARPCVTPEIIARVVTAVTTPKAGFDVLAATASRPIVDTLATSAEPFDTRQARYLTVGPPRDNLFAVQTPQAFHRELLNLAHSIVTTDDSRATDDTALVQRLKPRDPIVQLVDGSIENIKVTRPEDMALAEAILARRQMPAFRVGHGYDVHQFADGRPLVLGGVTFPDAPRGLLGHSDADVILHALCDALLGAAGMGDIGTLFPPSDMRHKDRPSIEFLLEVQKRLSNAGWRVGNVDITVLAETPKVNPHVAEMKDKIAQALNLTVGQVGIKATTNEGLGFVGRKEGIAANAVVLLIRA